LFIRVFDAVDFFLPYQTVNTKDNTNFQGTLTPLLIGLKEFGGLATEMASSLMSTR